jgi:hypothetical protein
METGMETQQKLLDVYIPGPIIHKEGNEIKARRTIIYKNVAVRSHVVVMAQFPGLVCVPPPSPRVKEK